MLLNSSSFQERVLSKAKLAKITFLMELEDSNSIMEIFMKESSEMGCLMGRGD